MAQDLNFDHFIDVDKPSVQRIRNILTLKEKVAAIKAYEQSPMYKKVARMFNCSWEQIRSIIVNRNAIMDFYNAAINQNKPETIEDDLQMDIKQRKIKFLGECVYECIQRLQYHAKVPITEDLIRHKALEFLDVLRIPGFTPSKKWLNLFKATYSISLSNKAIAIYTKPQSSLEIKDIMTFCTKVKSTPSLIKKYNKQDQINGEYETKRLRKLNFLKEALKEYFLRVKYHHKSMKLDAEALSGVAKEINEILKVQDFEPTPEWINNFIKCCDIEEYLANVKKPSLSLDLKDILSYCSRMQNKAKDNTITLAPKSFSMRVMPKFPEKSFTESGIKFQSKSIIYLDEQESGGEKDIKPDIEEISVERPHLVKTPTVETDIKPDIEELRLQRPQQEAPPLKIRKIESINNDPELQRKFHTNTEIRKVPLIMQREKPKETPKSPAKTFVYIQKVNPTNVSKENIVHLNQQTTNVEIKKESPDPTNYILPSNNIILPFTSTPPPHPQLRIQQVHHQVLPSCISTLVSQPPSSHNSADNDSEELPHHVTSFKDVLLLLKPLEEYAMLKENYRAIGLITQLEEVFKNQPEEENTRDDDEFIG